MSMSLKEEKRVLFPFFFFFPPTNEALCELSFIKVGLGYRYLHRRAQLTTLNIIVKGGVAFGSKVNPALQRSAHLVKAWHWATHGLPFLSFRLYSDSPVAQKEKS